MFTDTATADMQALTGMLSSLLIAQAIALLGAVAAAFLFFSPKRRDSYQGFLKRLCSHLNFDRFLISPILKFLYVYSALSLIVLGLVTLFSGAVLQGLMLVVLGPLGARVVFELLMLLLSLREEAAETNELLRRMQGLPPKNPPRPVQPETPSPRVQQAARTARQADPRYAQRQPAYPPANQGFAGYTSQPRQPVQPQPYPDMAASQRYAPVQGGQPGYDGAAYPQTQLPQQAQPVLRPTPADGTGRFTAVPMSDKARK